MNRKVDFLGYMVEKKGPAVHKICFSLEIKRKHSMYLEFITANGMVQ